MSSPHLSSIPCPLNLKHSSASPSSSKKVVRYTYSLHLKAYTEGSRFVCHAVRLSVCLTRLQLLDRCLKIVDPELFTHLRSKNLSAEIYAFPCEFVVHQSGDGSAVLIYEHSRPNPMCMHAATRPGAATMGLPARIRCAPQRPLRHCTAPTHARRGHGLVEVRLLTPSKSASVVDFWKALCAFSARSRLSKPSP